MKFIIDNIWLIGLVLVSGGALLWPSLQRRGEKVSLLQTTQLINQGKAVIVDVREPAEFAAGHLRDAKNVPFKELANRLGELDKFKSKTVIAVCQNGVASAKAAARSLVSDCAASDRVVAGSVVGKSWRRVGRIGNCALST